ncbi:hypothetical protein AAC387_Pa10g2128 [Persea americana]
MSKEISSSRIPARSSSSRHGKPEGNENEFENPPNSIRFPPARTPLNSIQDPSSQIDDSDSKLRSEAGRSSRFFSEKKAEVLDYATPRAAVRLNSHSEPNSAQSTPARSVWKASNYGSSVAACTSGRPPQGGRGGSLSKVSRGISTAAASPWPLVEVPHFVLVEDSSFWMDHNVQLLYILEDRHAKFFPRITSQELDSRNVSESSAVRHSLLLRAENQELEKRLCIMAQENIRLMSAFAAKEDEINTLVEEWEKATFDLTSFLVDGCLSLEEASEQIGSIVSLFSQRKNWIGEQVERAVKVFIEKEQTIVYLQKRLEEAQKMGMEMQLKLNSLKGATMAISEVHQQEKDENFKEVNQLKTLLSEKMFTIRDLGEKLENKEHQIIEAEKRANATLIALKWLYEMNDVNFGHGSVEKLPMNEPAAESLQRNSSIQRKDADISESILHVKFQMNDINEESPKLVSSFGWHKDELQYISADANARALGEIGAQVEMARQRVTESETAICASYLDTEKYLSALLSDILCTSSAVRKMVHDLINDIRAMKKKFMRLNDCSTKISCLELESPSREGLETSKLKRQYSLVHLVRGEIVKTNEKLDALKASIDTLSSVHRCTVKVGDPAILGLNMLACRVCKTRWFQPRHEDCYSGHGIEEMVYEMGEEVERHRLMREDLVLEIQALRERMLTVENVSENLDEGNSDIEEIMKDQLLSESYRSSSSAAEDEENRCEILADAEGKYNTDDTALNRKSGIFGLKAVS